SFQRAIRRATSSRASSALSLSALSLSVLSLSALVLWAPRALSWYEARARDRADRRPLSSSSRTPPRPPQPESSPIAYEYPRGRKGQGPYQPPRRPDSSGIPSGSWRVPVGAFSSVCRRAHVVGGRSGIDERTRRVARSATNPAE